MRLPNGYGSVTKLKGKRRNAWAVRKTTGWTDDKKAIVKYVGYYPTRADALAALAAYNKSPYKTVTIDDLYDKWSEESGVSARTLQTYTFAYKHLGKLAHRDMTRIRLDDFQEVLNSVTTSTGRSLKIILSGVYSYAVRHDYIGPERAALVKYLKASDTKSRTVTRAVFTMEEIEACKDHAVRVLLYTGMRISELLHLTPDCIHIDERYLEIRQAKTKAGVRKVPIAEKIVEDVKALDCLGRTYDSFRNRHWPYENHTVHDTRHTFISRCADLGISANVIKAIVGHAGTDITETVYTHLDLGVLLEAVNRL